MATTASLRPGGGGLRRSARSARAAPDAVLESPAGAASPGATPKSVSTPSTTRSETLDLTASSNAARSWCSTSPPDAAATSARNTRTCGKSKSPSWSSASPLCAAAATAADFPDPGGP